jgi:hypothetical protein
MEVLANLLPQTSDLKHGLTRDFQEIQEGGLGWNRYSGNVKRYGLALFDITEVAH